MHRREIMAIVGAYSRQGFSAYPVQGGFLLNAGRGNEGRFAFRTAREARRDTGIDYASVERLALNFDLR